MLICSGACTGARFSSLETAGRFTITAISRIRTPAGTEWWETSGTICTPSESRRVGVSAVTHLSRTAIQSWSYFNVKGSLGSNMRLITACDNRFLVRAPRSISTCNDSAKDSLSILMWLILWLVRINPTRPTFGDPSWSVRNCLRYYLAYIDLWLSTLLMVSFGLTFNSSQCFFKYLVITLFVSWIIWQNYYSKVVMTSSATMLVPARD